MAEKALSRPAPEKKTVIEDGTAFKGTLSANCPVVVRGQVEGEITGPSLEVAESGTVNGRVKVTELRSKGELTGTFEADDVVLCGRVRDQTVIVAKTLEVVPPKSGSLAVELHDCELQIGVVPAKEAALREALVGAAGQLGPSGGNGSGRDDDGAVVADKATPATPTPTPA